MFAGYRDTVHGENAHVSLIVLVLTQIRKLQTRIRINKWKSKLLFKNQFCWRNRSKLKYKNLVFFYNTVLEIILNLVLFFFYIRTFYSWNTCRNKTSVCGSASYPRTNLPQAIPDPSAGIPICSEMNNPHIPHFPSHTVNMCNICGDTPRRLSSCSPPQLCCSRKVVSPDVIPIILLKKYLSYSNRGH